MQSKKEAAPKTSSIIRSDQEGNLPIYTSTGLEAQDISQKLSSAFPIVGIGASAGGLAAFEAFFAAMPKDRDPGMAFVLVQHLAPDHKSILKELIQRYTRMQAFEVTDGMQVQMNCIYIIPPNCDISLSDGVLHTLQPSAPRGQRLPIDFFFRSLAHDQHEFAICIVLSGTGSDGSFGTRAIKGEGGLALAQTPESTEYDGMPRSAIETGVVDYVLTPAEMPAQLISYKSLAFAQSTLPIISTQIKPEKIMTKIFAQLRIQTGHDFSEYKINTIRRHVTRRMAVKQIETLDEYTNCLQHNPIEVEMLFRDMLIGVTNFFRDPDAFKALEDLAIPKLLEQMPNGATIRVWVPGCSTGEEAYSIAILLQEFLEAIKKNQVIQVFATDIDSRAIAIARSGCYPISIATDINPERLARFFTLEPDGKSYRIHRNIRDLIVFSEQDVIKDPPISKIDLISCRNLLIYFGPSLQKKLIPMFHYALKPGGILFLGKSESVGEFDNLFTLVDRNAKLFVRKEGYQNTQHGVVSQFFPPLVIPPMAIRSHVVEKVDISIRKSLREITEQALLQRENLVGVLVNNHGDIFYLHGHAGIYLEPPPGEAGILNIIKMARKGLQYELSNALQKACSTKKPVYRYSLKVKTNGNDTIANVAVIPLSACSIKAEEIDTYLVVLEELPGHTKELHQDTDDIVQSEKDEIISALKQELVYKDEYLQSINEQLESINEELSSSNEEMQSVNEELQSTNEELETSKEELQSINEELITVNTELQTKVADLSSANNDLNNLLASTGIGTIFVNLQQRIKRFTPSAVKIVNLIFSDIGRPIAHVSSNLVAYDSLTDDIQEVLNNLVPKEIEVLTKDGRWYTMRIQPYRTLDNVIEGAVITFVDITVVVIARETLKELNDASRPKTTEVDS